MKQSQVKILVVDDAPNWRDYMKAYLKSIGGQVYTAENLKDGLNALKKHAYHLAIVDVRLLEGDPEDVSGLSIVKHAWITHRVTRFIVISGFLVETKVRSELSGIPYEIFDKADITNQQFKDSIKGIIEEAETNDA